MKMHIRALRVNANLTQDQVSSIMHVAKSTIVSWEAEKTFPRVDQLNALCDIYSCTMDDIFIPETLTLK